MPPEPQLALFTVAAAEVETPLGPWPRWDYGAKTLVMEHRKTLGPLGLRREGQGGEVHLREGQGGEAPLGLLQEGEITLSSHSKVPRATTPLGSLS